MTIKVAIGCHIHLFAEGIKRLLEEDREIEVVGIAGNIGELKNILPSKPEIVLADHAIGDTVFSSTAAVNPTKVLVMSTTAHFLPPYRDLQEMVAKGFAGILPRESDLETLRRSVKAVHAGDLWIDNKTLKTSLHHKASEKRTANITGKEKKVLGYLCQGYSNKEIAQQLFVTEQTVKAHINHLFKKFGVSNRVKLALCTQEIVSNPPKES